MKWRLKSLEKSSGASKAIWRDLKVKGGHQNMEAVRSETGETVVDPNEIREEIRKYMQNLGEPPVGMDNGVEAGGSRGVVGEEPGRGETLDVMAEEISMEECSKAIRLLKTGKAVGDDKIANELVKYGGQGLWEAIRDVLEQIRQEEWIPTEWKRERVILLHKGKSQLSLDNYRGIAIGSNVKWI